MTAALLLSVFLNIPQPQAVADSVPGDGPCVFVAAAMRREIEPFVSVLEDLTFTDLKGQGLFEGRLGGVRVLAGVSGPGLVNMASLMTFVCNEYRVGAVVNMGMVGGYGRHVHKGDLIIGGEVMSLSSYRTSQRRHGIRPSRWDYVTFSDGGPDTLVVHRADSSLTALAVKIGIQEPLKLQSPIHKGRIGSADVWCSEQKIIRMLMRRYGIICEDMEAVAVHQVAARFGVPCICVKGVSDNVFLHEDYDDSVLGDLSLFVEEFVRGLILK